jgi:hypothetical protein
MIKMYIVARVFKRIDLFTWAFIQENVDSLIYLGISEV